MSHGDENVLIDYAPFGKSSDVNSTKTSSIINKSKVVTIGLYVILIALPLMAIILSIIAISEQRAMATSLQKDRLSGPQKKPAQHFQRLTGKVNNQDILKNHLSQSQDINQIKRSMEKSLEEIKTKLSKLFSVAFHAVVDGHPVILKGSNVKFNVVTLNDGNGYNSTTGIFTVPEGGSGLYFFYLHMITTTGKFATFGLYKNDGQICVVDGDNTNNHDHDTITCGGVVQLKEGDRVYVQLMNSDEPIPLFRVGNRRYHAFTGFLMKPE